MKINVLIATLLILVGSTSCKNDKKADEVKEKPETFDVTLNMIVQQDDKFQLFYIQDGMQGFDEKHSVWVPVKGSPAAQDIVFHLPEDVLPANLRPDFGINEKQDPMKLNSFKISYYDKSYSVADSLILRNFVLGSQVKYDTKTSVITPNKGNAAIYDPYLYPQDNLKEEINKIIK